MLVLEKNVKVTGMFHIWDEALKKRQSEPIISSSVSDPYSLNPDLDPTKPLNPDLRIFFTLELIRNNFFKYAKPLKEVNP